LIASSSGSGPPKNPEKISRAREKIGKANASLLRPLYNLPSIGPIFFLASRTVDMISVPVLKLSKIAFGSPFIMP